MPPVPLVAVNDLPARRRRSGVGQYVAELLRAMAGGAPDLRVSGLCDRPAGWPLAWAARREARAEGPAEPRAEGTWRNTFAETRRRWAARGLDGYLAAASRLDRWALFHETNALAPGIGAPLVATVNDLGALLHPAWHPPRRSERFERDFRASAEKARVLLAISEDTRRTLLQVAPELAGRVVVAPLAPRSGFGWRPPATIAAARVKWRLPERYVLCVATIEPRKNHAALLHAYARLPAALRCSCPLALVGGWGWRSDAVRDMLGRPPWDTCVRWLGYVPDEEVVALTCGAAAFAFPSLHEGFGMPPLEAMACGVPVVASRAGALAETLGAAALSIEPEDEVALAEALRRVLSDRDLSADLVRRGYAQARRFSWAATAAATLSAYRRALGLPEPARAATRAA